MKTRVLFRALLHGALLVVIFPWQSQAAEPITYEAWLQNTSQVLLKKREQNSVEQIRKTLDEMRWYRTAEWKQERAAALYVHQEQFAKDLPRIMEAMLKQFPEQSQASLKEECVRRGGLDLIIEPLESARGMAMTNPRRVWVNPNSIGATYDEVLWLLLHEWFHAFFECDTAETTLLSESMTQYYTECAMARLGYQKAPFQSYVNGTELVRLLHQQAPALDYAGWYTKRQPSSDDLLKSLREVLLENGAKPIEAETIENRLHVFSYDDDERAVQLLRNARSIFEGHDRAKIARSNLSDSRRTQ